MWRGRLHEPAILLTVLPSALALAGSVLRRPEGDVSSARVGGRGMMSWSARHDSEIRTGP